MKRIISVAILLLLYISHIPGDLVADEASEGKPLTGVFVGKTLPARSLPGMEEATTGGKSDDSEIYADHSVVSEGLRAIINKMDPTETIRVIIQLNYQPQNVISKQVCESHATEMDEIRTLIRMINSRYAQYRITDTLSDADNYDDPAQVMSVEDKDALRVISEEHEALSLVVRDELAAQLRQEVEADQESVRTALEKLGAEVEYGALSVNLLVAVLPVSAIDDAAAIHKVARISEDVRHESCLTNADNATRVTDMGGLWDAGETGGTYDPAVIDSGTDLTHPMLEDDAGRTNFYSWYLVAAGADPDYDDVSTEDDMTGHGSHVMGIVASHGSDIYPSHLGMAPGVNKAVTLKAGFRDIDGDGSMYNTDGMWIVDRALYTTEMLQPFSTFNDDVDGMNLSYGGPSEGYDESYYSLFYDAVVSTYPDLPVTISAGNKGPSNFWFSLPGSAYNPITVANVDDKNTTSRADDSIWSSSSRGPTAIGRRKPDIAAPGAIIASCNTNWETELDHIEYSGTSMSAPMVLGVAMDLMDAGVTDELEIKALLINTAQKNDGAIDFDNDADGWNQYYGWGYMNALAAYHHRTDLFKDTVTPYPNTGHYHLYKGQMRDEGSSSEGRDRATMVWNKHVTYNPHDYPGTWADLSNLNLYLFEEADNTLHDYDVSTIDNVAQVRVNDGAGITDVIINALAFDTVFDHGGPTEEFALATEEDFVEVSIPATFSATGNWRQEMEPNEEADFSFWLTNNSEIASHTNTFNLQLPPGWTLVSGGDPYSAGTMAGEGGTSAQPTWRLRAQPTPEDGVQVGVDHSHYSYYVEWGPFSWSMPVNVRWDTTPPSPSPTWAVAPYATSTSQISMSCTPATDLHQPVTYFFDFYYSPTGGSGGSDSGFNTTTIYTDSGLSANHRYGYRVAALDNAQSPNSTGYNAPYYVYTRANVPGTPSVTNPTDSTLDVTINANGNPSYTECAIWVDAPSGAVGDYYLNASGGSNGSTLFWQPISSWGTVTATGLDSGIQYGFKVIAHNGDDFVTGWSSSGLGTTTLTVTDTFSCDYTITPLSGTVPFSIQHRFSLTNLQSGTLHWTRRIAGKVHVISGNGNSYSNWRGGFTNVQPGDTYTTAFSVTVPAALPAIGNNTFTMITEDVTDAPYNQPPYPPSGTTCTQVNVVVAYAP